MGLLASCVWSFISKLFWQNSRGLLLKTFFGGPIAINAYHLFDCYFPIFINKCVIYRRWCLQTNREEFQLIQFPEKENRLFLYWNIIAPTEGRILSFHRLDCDVIQHWEISIHLAYHDFIFSNSSGFRTNLWNIFWNFFSISTSGMPSWGLNIANECK